MAFDTHGPVRLTVLSVSLFAMGAGAGNILGGSGQLEPGDIGALATCLLVAIYVGWLVVSTPARNATGRESVQ